MATTISKMSINLSANATEVKSELDKVEARAKNLEKAVRGLPETGAKTAAAFSQIGAAGRVFETMSSDASVLDKAVIGVQGSVMALTSGLGLATKMATGLKAALLGTGIGVAILAIGAVSSAMSARSREEEEAAGTPAMDFARRHTRPTPSRMSWDWASAGGPSWSLDSPGLPPAADVSEVAAAIGDVGPRAETAAKAIDEMTRSSGRSREEIAYLDASARRLDMVRTARSSVLASEAFRALSRDTERLRDGLLRVETGRFATGAASMASSARHAMATMGMSEGAAARYGLTLRSVTRVIDGVAVTTREAVTPAQAHARRMAALRAELAAGTITAERFAEASAASARAMATETRELDSAVGWVSALSRARERAALMARGVTETDRLRTPVEQLNAEIERMGGLWRAGATSFETFSRGLEGLAGAVDAGPMAALSARMAAITRLEDEARRAHDERTRSVEASGRLFGMLGIRNEASRPELDLSGFEERRAAALLDLADSDRATEIAAPQALLEGSAAAVSAINAARRAQPEEDLVERTNRILEQMRADAERRTTATREMRDALREGIIRL